MEEDFRSEESLVTNVNRKRLLRDRIHRLVPERTRKKVNNLRTRSGMPQKFYKKTDTGKPRCNKRAFKEIVSKRDGISLSLQPVFFLGSGPEGDEVL